MIFAIIQIRGKQYKIQIDDYINLPFLNYPVGTILTINKVLLIANKTHTIIGQPLIKDFNIKIKIIDHINKSSILAQILSFYAE